MLKSNTLKIIFLSISCARPSHWIKNLFMLPGFALALTIENHITANMFLYLAIGLISTSLLSSANYSLNELLDSNYDKQHPIKKKRPLAQNLISYKLIIFQYFVLTIIGIGLATLLTPMFLLISIIFLFMGLIYNVPPIRAKEIVYVDVLVEAINNPIRLFLGWSSICTIIAPPASFIICYWFGGAFLMAMKRYSEFKLINNKDTATKYRKSFGVYNLDSLLLSAFYYSLFSIFFLGIFIIKYHIEFIIIFLFISFLFIWYAYLVISAEDKDEISTDNLYKKKMFLGYFGLIGFFTIILFFVEIPFLNYLIDHSVLLDIKVDWIDLYE